MIISCLNCTTRLQLDDAKLPQRPFTVRCPKCQQIINAQPPTTPQGDAASVVGDLPASTRSQRETGSTVVPVLNIASDEEAERPAQAGTAPDGAEIARMLAALLGGAAGDKTNGAGRRPAWDKRRALVCVSTSHKQEIVEELRRGSYEVFTAQNTAQALERMREDKIDVLVLDPEFDLMEQGAAFITREVNSLRPSERRRLIFVQLSPEARTEDAHAAFLSNVNLVVNMDGVRELPSALERTVRDLNELYKDFNKALGVSEL